MTEQAIEIKNFDLDDIPEVKLFTDQWIGDNYFSHEDLEIVLMLSCWKDLNASFVARVNGELAGVRLTYAPGTWLDQTRPGLTPEFWQVSAKYVAYFKSLFIAEKFQQMGIGKRLSAKSIEVLLKQGAKAIICHSWIQSPGNSSQIYLDRMGFRPVKEHLRFWYPIDYECPVCSPERCECTALEMIKYL